MKPTIALSSCWSSARHQDGFAMLQEMAALGFTHAELSHGVRLTLVPGILQAVEQGVIRIASCHNFCPLPGGVNHAAPNLYLPSSRDARERDQWLRQSRRTIDFAAQVGAAKVVLHLGSLEFFWMNPARRLESHAGQPADGALTDDADYRKRLARTLVRLRRNLPPYWENVKTMLAALAEYAAGKGIVLGCENRERLDELPLDGDHAELLEAIGQPAVCGYWHDTGHAHIKEHLGVLNHRAHLERLSGRVVGWHLHDVVGGDRDHQPIGSGNIDFEMVSEFWRSEHTLVLEFSPRLTVEQVVASKQRVDALVARRFA